MCVDAWKSSPSITDRQSSIIKQSPIISRQSIINPSIADRQFAASSQHLLRPGISPHHYPPPAPEHVKPTLDDRSLDVAVHEFTIDIAGLLVRDRVRSRGHLAVDEFLERPHAAVWAPDPCSKPSHKGLSASLPSRGRAASGHAEIDRARTAR